jgi:hypothetical protein
MNDDKRIISVIRHMAAYCSQIAEMVGRFDDSIGNVTER